MPQNDHINVPLRACISDNQENCAPSEHRESNEEYERDTPTRVRVKTLSEIGLSRNAIFQ